MRKNRFRTCIAAALSISVFAGLLAGCAKETAQSVTIEPMEAEESHAFGFDIAGGLFKPELLYPRLSCAVPSQP